MKKSKIFFINIYINDRLFKDIISRMIDLYNFLYKLGIVMSYYFE